MRKADYSLLAELIAAEIRDARETLQKCAPADIPATSAVAYTRVATAERIARQFVARRASVDSVAFLTACGLTS